MQALAAFFMHMPQPPMFFGAFLLFCLGACMGSFINVVVHRLPLMFKQALAELWAQEFPPNHQNGETSTSLTLSQPASSCPTCQKRIRWYDNLPIVSWLYLRGRCRHCQASISSAYVWVELVTALLTPIIFYVMLHAGHSTAYAAALVIFAWQLLTIALLDAREQLLPMELSIPLIATGLYAASLGVLPISSADAIQACMYAWLALAGFACLFKWVRGIDGLGDGDPYLLAGIAAWLGAQAALYSILLACVLGLIWMLLAQRFYQRDIKQAIAFGPFICLGAFIYVVFLLCFSA